MLVASLGPCNKLEPCVIIGKGGQREGGALDCILEIDDAVMMLRQPKPLVVLLDAGQGNAPLDNVLVELVQLLSLLSLCLECCGWGD